MTLTGNDDLEDSRSVTIEKSYTGLLAVLVMAIGFVLLGIYYAKGGMN